jgi:hypothetical protein
LKSREETEAFVLELIKDKKNMHELALLAVRIIDHIFNDEGIAISMTEGEVIALEGLLEDVIDEYDMNIPWEYSCILDKIKGKECEHEGAQNE